ncbi:MAG: HD domain-containing protein [Candidatus Muirbacterium halophilum]|nr:HD domain-containing protein [Candidatus Muirbacterium halophilum]MCK9474704.1 HD domain-containing protein [Candidatus Muirbacterium halophilum]
MNRLLIKDLNGNEYYLELSSEANVSLNIGRIATNDIVFDDVKVSRNHARIRSGENSRFIIEDLDSSNGIYVNARRIKTKLLENGDEIRIGDSFINFAENDKVNEIIESIKSLNGEITQSIEGNKINIGEKINYLGSNMIKFIKFVEKGDVGEEAITSQLKNYVKFLKNIREGYEKVENEYKILSALNRISGAISNIYETREFFSSTLDIILSLLNSQRGFIMFFNKEKNDFEVKVARKMDSEIRNIDSFSHKIVQNVFEEDNVLIVNSPQDDSRFSNGKSIFENSIKAAIAAPLKYKGENIGVIYLDRQADTEGFNNSDKEFFKSYANYCSLSFERVKMFSELEESYLASIKVLANVLDAKDPYTHGHSERVMEYSVAIAYKMGLNEKDVKNIEFGALLHDIGKVGVDLSILNKPGRLTEDEFAIIKTHPEQGYQIIAPVKFLQDKFSAIKYHHEKWDGTGYPDGLSGEDIPLDARIVAVADTFDAMTSTRSYRKALDKEIAVEEIKRVSGTQFDPRIVEAFLKVVNKESITQVFSKGQELQKKVLGDV